MARKRKERQSAHSVFVPAPSGGWNTEQGLDSMPPTDAVRMINFFPDVGKVRYRGGTASQGLVPWGFSKEFSAEFQITYLNESDYFNDWVAGGMEAYNGTDGEGEVIVGIESDLFRYSPDQTDGLETVGATGVSSPYWTGAQFANIAGNYLFLANGVDNAKIYDGTIANDVEITGVTISDIAWFSSHQKRVWFGMKDSLQAYYLATEAIADTATSFDLGGVAQRGGYIVNMWTWTRDGGDGVNDVAVFVTSEGEAILYEGTDPASSTTWALIGVFRIGAPLNRRSAVQSGSDLLIATYDGIIPISQVLGNPIASQQMSPYTGKILEGYREAVRQARANDINQVSLTIHPERRMLILNLGQDTNCPRTQPSDDAEWSGYSDGWALAFNTVTGAACEFPGIKAGSFVSYQRDGEESSLIYYANGAGVRVVDEFRRFDDSGENVKYECVTAFNDFGLPTNKKTFSRYETVFATLINKPDPTTVLMTDEQEVTGRAFGPSGTLVGVIYKKILRYRKAGGRTGRSAAVNVRIQSTTAFSQATQRGEWLGVQYLFRVGGPL